MCYFSMLNINIVLASITSYLMGVMRVQLRGVKVCEGKESGYLAGE